VDDTGKILPKEFLQLTLYFLLQVPSDNLDRIERRRYVDVLQWVVLEDQCDALGFGYDQY
jgi:methyl coenzyme M reductase subunit C-like uncharacterized protein (methanogenesis marker protein 7)